MLSLRRLAHHVDYNIKRRLSTETSKSVPTLTASSTPTVIKNSGGSTFFQRLSSFLAGCGIGFGLSTYFIYNELVEANEKLERSIKLIQKK